MSKSKTVDRDFRSSGPILKTLAELALPIMISSMLGTAYSIMDMAWIGLLGAKAVAGVGVGGMYVWLSQGLASLSRMGGQVNTAQACGRKDYDQARSYAASSLQLTATIRAEPNTVISVSKTDRKIHTDSKHGASETKWTVRGRSVTRLWMSTEDWQKKQPKQ